MENKTYTPFDIVNNLTMKTGVIDEHNIKGVMFPTLRWLSNEKSLVPIVNIANRINGEYNQYLFLYYLIPKGKRYIKYPKQLKASETIIQIMTIYNYSREKAEQVYPLLQNKDIGQFLYTGGKRKYD